MKIPAVVIQDMLSTVYLVTTTEDMKEELCFVVCLEPLTLQYNLFRSVFLVSETGCFSWRFLPIIVMRTLLTVLQLPGLAVQTEAPNQQDKQPAVKSKYSMKDITGIVVIAMSGAQGIIIDNLRIPFNKGSAANPTARVCVNELSHMIFDCLQFASHLDFALLT